MIFSRKILISADNGQKRGGQLFNYSFDFETESTNTIIALWEKSKMFGDNLVFAGVHLIEISTNYNLLKITTKSLRRLIVKMNLLNKSGNRFPRKLLHKYFSKMGVHLVIRCPNRRARTGSQMPHLWAASSLHQPWSQYHMNPKSYTPQKSHVFLHWAL